MEVEIWQPRSECNRESTLRESWIKQNINIIFKILDELYDTSNDADLRWLVDEVLWVEDDVLGKELAKEDVKCICEISRQAKQRSDKSLEKS